MSVVCEWGVWFVEKNGGVRVMGCVMELVP